MFCPQWIRFLIVVLRRLARWVRLLFVTGSSDGCVTVFVQKIGQISFREKKLCLCLNHKQVKTFINSLNTNNLLRFTISSKATNKILKSIVVFYQATFSFFLGGNCRFYPSCSCYAKEAYEAHSAMTASFLVIKRVFSCHPFSRKSNFDPVPAAVINLKHRGFCEIRK